MIERSKPARWALAGLVLLSAVLAAAPARAQTSAEDALLIRLAASTSTAVREGACADLARLKTRSPEAFKALSTSMTRDLSDRVRLAAAKAIITFPGDDALRLADEYLKSEPGAEDRGLFLMDLATEPAHIENSDVTRTIAALLDNDPNAEVRRAAALSLSRRGDSVGLPSALRAQQKDADESVRASALMAVSVLSKKKVIKKSKGPPKAAAPKADAVKGLDPCPPPWAWCECTGVIVRPPKCRTRSECHVMYNGVLQIGISCTWSGIDLKQDLDSNEKLPSPQ